MVITSPIAVIGAKRHRERRIRDMGKAADHDVLRIAVIVAVDTDVRGHRDRKQVGRRPAV